MEGNDIRIDCTSRILQCQYGTAFAAWWRILPSVHAVSIGSIENDEAL